MINPTLKWALHILQHPEEISVSESVSNALKLVSIDSKQIQINCQPLESIFSAIATDDEQSSIDKKKIGWQELDAQHIVYPKGQVDDASLDIPEPPGGWDRYHDNTNLALVLIEKYGSFLSISSQVPYISFYDVVKSTAAIHDCLERGQTDKPFLLVSGDFSGIQDAIYTIASSGALKTLRARSFMLELLTEHIVYEIQQATSSERYSHIFSGGGGFSLLVPNTEENLNAINAFAQVINTWLLEQFGFELFLALHCEPLNEDAIKGDQFKDTWESIADKLGKQKQRKFWNTSNFKALFSPTMPVHVHNQDACQITHRDDLPEHEMVHLDGIGRVSKLAYRLWRLGDLLTDFDSIVRLPTSEDSFRNGTLRFPTHQGEYAEYRVNRSSQDNEYEVRWLINSWELDNYDEKTYPFLFGEYVRSVADLSTQQARSHEKEEFKANYGKEMDKPEDITASFSGLAKTAQGSEMVGCLRMDVDNFGALFSRRLVESSVAAISNLSRSMNLFFKGYLNQICGMELGTSLTPLDITGDKADKITKGRDVSIVYAGGDDLFIVGAWDDVAELAFDINVCFKTFTCDNPDIHLSGGVTLHKPKFPLYQMARISKRAEASAKANSWDAVEAYKNSLSLFYSDDLAMRDTMLNQRIEIERIRHPQWGQKINRIAVASQWHEYEDMIELAKRLHEAYPEISQGFYRKLFETLKIWQEEGVMYMPMMSHTLRQLDQIQPQYPKLAKLLRKLLFQHDNMRKLHIPLQWVEYLNR